MRVDLEEDARREYGPTQAEAHVHPGRAVHEVDLVGHDGPQQVGRGAAQLHHHQVCYVVSASVLVNTNERTYFQFDIGDDTQYEKCTV